MLGLMCCRGVCSGGLTAYVQHLDLGGTVEILSDLRVASQVMYILFCSFCVLSWLNRWGDARKSRFADNDGDDTEAAQPANKRKSRYIFAIFSSSVARSRR